MRNRSAWDRYLRAQYRLIQLLDPLVRPIWRSVGLADTEELVVSGRRTGRPRPVLVGLLRVGGHWYVGHPNGDAAQWVRNLAAAGRATIRFRDGTTTPVRASQLSRGPERDRVIRETFRQHAFPGNLVYYLARRHIATVGTFFRLEARSDRGAEAAADLIETGCRTVGGPGQRRCVRAASTRRSWLERPLDP